MLILRFFLVFVLLFEVRHLNAIEKIDELSTFSGDEQVLLVNKLQIERPGPFKHFDHFGKRSIKLNRKLTAAMLAFPFPFGIVGLHRIYMGCAPYVPVVYIASLGGIFGIVPLIDCIVILAEKDVDRYSNSRKVFMWVE